MLRQRKKKAECELDMAPMIDMVFLLLIFFMCSATMQNLSTPEDIQKFRELLGSMSPAEKMKALHDMELNG